MPIQYEAPCKEKRKISSSYIKDLIRAGQIGYANDMLGRCHFVRSTVVKGFMRGRTIGYPTANFGNIDVLLPKDGVYWGYLTVYFQDKSVRFFSVASLGASETFNAENKTLEVNAIAEKNLELYGLPVKFEFGGFLRPMRKFESKSDLIAQLNEDVAVAVKIRNTKL
jgi:riboflavin kinase/FMN adenylyltransferase